MRALSDSIPSDSSHKSLIGSIYLSVDATRVDDSVLLRSYAARGDVAAFRELVKRYADMVYATARRVTGNEASAQDVSQDCFLRLAQSSTLVRGSLAGWLHRASVNRSLEINRCERARRLRETEAAQRHEEQDQPMDEAATLLSRVDEALAALPDELRILVTEHFLCGRSQIELATAMGVNQSTVHRRIEKGLEQLRRRLKEESSALSLFLLGLRNTPAPSGLRQALTKIGLSGIGGGAAAAGKGISTAALLKLLGLGLALLLMIGGGAVLYRAQTDPAWRGAAAPQEASLPLDQLPAPVRKALDQTAPAATYSSIERKRVGDKTVYDIDATTAGRKVELTIQEDGTVLAKRSG
jgi:RNA polymerase sigma-70 factor (ECF subfamily)